MLRAATDGSSLGNPGPSGWAWVIEDGRADSAGARHSTNNRMDLRALIELLESSDPNEGLRISVDSQYVMKIFTEWLPRWRERGMRTSKNKPVENIDLIERADRLLTDRQFEFEWVKGHDGHPMNEQADRLANAAAMRAREKLRGGA